jgi:signal transduction histidine kinase
MPRKHSLRWRLVAAFVLLAVAVCAFFAGVALYVEQEMERDLMEARLRALAQWQQERQPMSGTAASSVDLPPGSAYLTGDAIPPALRTLDSGFHEIESDGRDWQVLIGTTLQGERFAAINDSTEFERIERDVALALGLGLFASAVLAVVLGGLMAGRIAKPLTQLAESVRTDSLDANPSLLERRDEVGELARAFDARTAELERFLMRERLFTGDVSHELRTPLAVVLGAADVVAARAGQQPELRAAVERIRRTAAEAADRVGALLMLSRAPESLEAPLVALAEIVEREAERCRPLLVDRPVELVVERRDPAWVEAPPQLASMAVGNLIRNACQYTEAGRIVVRLDCDRLVVEDSGPGLPDRVRAQLFERFIRFDDATSSGAGLGLALVKRICDHLMWTVQVDEVAGAGTRFTVRFPAGTATARASRTRGGGERPPERLAS